MLRCLLKHKFAPLSAIVSAFCLLLSPLTLYADTVANYNPGFPALSVNSSASESAFENAYSIVLSSDAAFVSSLNYEQTSEDYPMQRVFNNVDYSLGTTTLTIDMVDAPTNLRAISYSIPVSMLFSDIGFSSFDSFDLAFLFNAYGRDASEPLGFNQRLDFVCELWGTDSSGNSNLIYLPIERVVSNVYNSGSIYYNAWSVFRIVATSDHLYFFSDFTDLRLHFQIIAFNGDIIDDLQDLDFGLYSGQIGYGSTVPGMDLTVDPWEIYDPWDDLPDLEPWDPPVPSGFVTIQDFFDLWNTSDLVSNLITPLLLTSIGYFSVRVILWKEV